MLWILSGLLCSADVHQLLSYNKGEQQNNPGRQLNRELLGISTGKTVSLHFTASCIRKENKKEKQVAVLATAGNKQRVRRHRVGLLMGVGGGMLGMEVAADGPFCRACEPQPPLLQGLLI